jgi:hypothetical protein
MIVTLMISSKMISDGTVMLLMQDAELATTWWSTIAISAEHVRQEFAESVDSIEEIFIETSFLIQKYINPS